MSKSGYWDHYNATHPCSRASDDNKNNQKEDKADTFGSLMLSFKNYQHENSNFRRNDFDPRENNNVRANNDNAGGDDD
jgi:hypothetical protein